MMEGWQVTDLSDTETARHAGRNSRAASSMFSSSQLKERPRPFLPEETPQDWCVRIHRAISWLVRSE